MQSLPTTLFSAGLACLFGTILIFWVVVPGIVDWQITKIVRLEKGNLVWNALEDMEASIMFNVYLFNVTNPEEISKGGTPNLVQIGPYVYEEKRTKLDMTAHENNDTVTFQPRVMYYFRPDLSNGTEEDVITMINTPLVAVGDELATWSRMIRYMAKYYITSFEEKLFIQRSIKEAFFQGVFVEMIESVSSLLGRDYLPNNTFGYFYDKNRTEPYKLEIMSGVEDSTKFGQIVTYDGKSKMDIWDGESCNMINGSDNTIQPAFVTKDTVLRAFEPDICRSVHLTYAEDVEYDGIAAYRFTLPKNFFSSENPDNQCFCKEKDKSKCLTDGVSSIAACKWGAPMMISNPHFLYADSKYLEGVTGLSPNASIHESEGYVEPRSGVLLAGNKRIQFNVRMQPSNDVPELYNVKDVVIPLFWIDEVLRNGPNQMDMVHSKLLLPLRILEVLKWGFLAISTILTAIGVMIFMMKTRSMKPVEFYETTQSDGRKNTLFIF